MSWRRTNIFKLVKSSLLAHRIQLSQGAPTLTDAEIEELEQDSYGKMDEEDMMVDHLKEEEELEAMIASYEENQPGSQHRPPSPSWTDEDFDDISMDLIIPDQPTFSNIQQPQNFDDQQMHGSDQ
jgi:hypothetical protein